MDKNKFIIDTYNKIAQQYTNQYFNDLSDKPYIDKFLNLIRDEKILDIGCGPGNWTKYLLDQGFAVEGIDLSEEMIKIAKSKVPQGKFSVMDMRQLTFAPETFGGLLVAYSLIHISSDEILNTLGGLNKVLKSQGLALFITQKGEDDRVIDEPLMNGEKIFINFFTSQRISNYLSQSGFKMVFQEEKSSTDPDLLSNKIIYTIVRKN